MDRLLMRDDVQVKRTFIVTPTSLPSFPTVRRQIWTMATSVIKVSISLYPSFELSVINAEADSVLRIRDISPGYNFFPSRIRIFSIPDHGFASKNVSILAPIKWFQRSQWSGLFIPDPDPDFLPIPDPGSRGKKAPDSGFGSATLGEFGSGLTTKPVTRICWIQLGIPKYFLLLVRILICTRNMYRVQ